MQARGHLLETIWEAAPDIQTRTVDMHVQRLRTKLGTAGPLIETVRRVRVPDESREGARRVRLRSRLLLGALCVIAVQVVVVVLLVERQLSASLRDDAVAALAREARVVATHWTPEVDPIELAHADGRALGHRVTLIRPDGVVVGDTDFDKEGLQALENHARRPEVVARAGGVG